MGRRGKHCVQRITGRLEGAECPQVNATAGNRAVSREEFRWMIWSSGHFEKDLQIADLTRDCLRLPGGVFEPIAARLTLSDLGSRPQDSLCRLALGPGIES